MLQVGFGVSDITPDVGMQMPGGFFVRHGKGVRDKLLAVACVVEDYTLKYNLSYCKAKKAK